jgi:hypothetical protein
VAQPAAGGKTQKIEPASCIAAMWMALQPRLMLSIKFSTAKQVLLHYQRPALLRQIHRLTPEVLANMSDAEFERLYHELSASGNKEKLMQIFGH